MGTNCGKHLCKGKHDCGSCGVVNQGKWLSHGIAFVCSLCKATIVVEQGTAEMNFCPNCGAKMDLEE